MPWGRLDDSLYDHPKLDDFPTDEPSLRRIIDSLPLEDLVRLAGVGLWARAISYSNRHLTDGAISRSVIVRRLGASPELADAVVHSGLFDVTPSGVCVHDFGDFNDARTVVLERREADAKRQREWRDKRRKARNGVTGAVTSSVNGAGVTAGVTPSSRARESRPVPVPSRPGPESLERGSRAGGRADRADVAALRSRGWRRVTRAQRQVLDEILARHDQTGPEFAAEAIRLAPEGADPLEAAMAADRLWQESQRRRAAAEEQAASEARATEAEEPVPDWVGGLVRSMP